MRSILLILSFIMSSTLSLSAAHAKWGGHKGAPAMHFIKELNLTPEQTAQVSKIKEKYAGQKEEKREAVKAAKEDLIKSLQNPQRGEDYNKLLTEKFKKVEALKLEKDLQRFQMSLEIRDILTDEQIKKFQESREHGRKGKKHHADHEK